MMPVQKLIAKTTSEGLKRIREEIGRDALILKTIKRNGKVEFFVEAEEPIEPKKPREEPASSDAADPGLRNEYQQARLKMLSAIAARSDTAKELTPDTGTPSKPASGQRRQSMLTELTVKSLIEGLELSPATGARLRGFKRIDEVVDNLALMIQSAKNTTEGIHAFVGPAGSGKTTSLIKLMTRHILQFGEDSCAIINCDRFRMGAKEQMTRLGELMGIDVLHVGPSLDLNQALANVHKRQFIAIDMPGLGMQDEQLNAELFRLSSSHYDIRRFLVMPANLQFSSMQLVRDCFASRKGTSTILTRLDEVSSLGAGLSFLAQSELSLAYTSDGSHIPEDIAIGRGDELVHRAMKLMGGEFAKAALSDLTKGQEMSNQSFQQHLAKGSEVGDYSQEDRLQGNFLQGNLLQGNKVMDL
jgi:flagellar biosynthesis GTPase FlhF